jgi:hypothetical protein
MRPKMAQNGVFAGGGSQETPAGSRASPGLSGGQEKAGEDSPVWKMVVESGPGLQLILSTDEYG